MPWNQDDGDETETTVTSREALEFERYRFDKIHAHNEQVRINETYENHTAIRFRYGTMMVGFILIATSWTVSVIVAVKTIAEAFGHQR